MDTQTKTTQTTLKGLGRAEYLGTSIRTHKDMTSSKLDESFGVLPLVEEGTPPWPNWTRVQDANLFKLDTATDDTVLASQAHKDTKMIVNEIMERRDDVMKGMGQRHRYLRGSFGSTYTEDALHLVGLEYPFLRAYLPAREQTRTVAKRIRVPGLRARLGEPRADQTHLDLDKIATGVETNLSRYEDILADLTRARKRRDEALIAKRAAEKHLNATIANVARVQEGYYRMAGLDDLADRIRLTIPQSSKKRTEPTTTTTTTTTTTALETEM